MRMRRCALIAADADTAHLPMPETQAMAQDSGKGKRWKEPEMSERTTTLMGREVAANELDGLPIRTLLPSDIYACFRTKSEWDALGFAVKPGARGQEMHWTPSPRAQTTAYFHESEVEGDFDESYRIRRAMDAAFIEESQRSGISRTAQRHLYGCMLVDLKNIWDVARTGSQALAQIADGSNESGKKRKETRAVMKRVNESLREGISERTFVQGFPPCAAEAALADELVTAWTRLHKALTDEDRDGLVQDAASSLATAAQGLTCESYETLCAALGEKPYRSKHIETFDGVLHRVREEKKRRKREKKLAKRRADARVEESPGPILENRSQQAFREDPVRPGNRSQQSLREELVRPGWSYLCCDGRFYVVDGVGTNQLSGEVLVLYHALFGDQERGLVLPLDAFSGPAERNPHRVTDQERNFTRCSVPALRA